MNFNPKKKRWKLLCRASSFIKRLSQVKIGFDAKRFFKNFTGLGNYSRFVIRALSEHAPENNYILFTTKLKTHPELSAILSYENIKIVTPPAAYRFLGATSIWRTWGISKSTHAKDLNVYHGLSQELPVNLPATVKKFVTVHDLIFIRYPKLYKSIDAAIYKTKVQAACRQADRIIAISEQTKDDIVQFLKTDPEKIDVVYQGCHPNFRKRVSPEKITSIKEKYKLPQKYILSVGTIEERKNVVLLVKALALLPVELRMHVLVIGRMTDYKKKIVEHAMRLRVSQWLLFLHDVSFTDLPAIYQGADVFVYPSLFEGFGIPVVEALESSLPVITSEGSCLKEAGGTGSIYINPEDEQELADQLKKVLSDDTLKEQMIATGRKHIEQFDPAVIAGKLIKIYKNT